ncbi:MAG: hypothetical protein ABI333_14810 [bacterium]
MRKCGIALLTLVAVFTLVTCKKKPADKAAKDDNVMQADDMDDMDGMGAMDGMDAMDDMDAMDAMDAMKAEEPRPVAKKPEDDAATANWGAIIKKSQDLVAILKGLKTLKDIKKNKDQIVALQVEILKMNLASAQAALKLDKAGVTAYLAKAAKANAENAKLKTEIMAEMGRLAKIKGVKKLQAKVMKEMGAKMTPIIKEMGEVQKKLMEIAK